MQKKQKSNFWERLSLKQMSHKQWESLCDGCGRCCLHKLIDEENTVHFTNVACRYLDSKSCKCTNYKKRSSLVTDCLTIDYNWGDKFDWLPVTCAYRLLHQGKKLPSWHPLISGSTESIHLSNVSVRGKTIKESKINTAKLYKYIMEE